jgi:hypothetical protein
VASQNSKPNIVFKTRHALLLLLISTHRASTLANRSNARHRPNIRAPPTPTPPRYMYPKCGNLCGQWGRKRFIASWDLRMSHFCPCIPMPLPPRVEVKGRKSSFCPPLHSVPECLSLRPNWLPAPSPPSECVSPTPWDQREGQQYLLAGEGMG